MHSMSSEESILLLKTIDTQNMVLFCHLNKVEQRESR